MISFPAEQLASEPSPMFSQHPILSISGEAGNRYLPSHQRENTNVQNRPMPLGLSDFCCCRLARETAADAW